MVREKQGLGLGLGSDGEAAAGNDDDRTVVTGVLGQREHEFQRLRQEQQLRGGRPRDNHQAVKHQLLEIMGRNPYQLLNKP